MSKTYNIEGGIAPVAPLS